MRIDVSISQADRSAILYAPNNTWVGTDNTLVVSVNLSRPSQFDLTIPIQGVLDLMDNQIIIPEEDITLGFYPKARITIAAGSTKATKTFYQELRTSRGEPSTFLYNECTITRFITVPEDRTFYNYVSGFAPLNWVSRKTIYENPPS